jgi:hypothetical protein
MSTQSIEGDSLHEQWKKSVVQGSNAQGFPIKMPGDPFSTHRDVSILNLSRWC